MRKCQVDGCIKEGKIEKFCAKHYNRKQKYGDPLAGPVYYGHLPEKERFMMYVEKMPESGCWHWRGAFAGGYGRFRMGYKNVAAHRASLLMFSTPPENFQKLLACHKCDNPRCVNPDHLFIGTHQDNIDDKMSKGRHATGHGVDYKHAKLTEDDVLEIRASELTVRELALKFGVTTSNITAIQTGKRWKHVGGKIRRHTEKHVFGETHPQSKLDAEKVRFIRNSDLSIRELAEHFGLAIMTVYDARLRRSWKHIE